MQSSIHDHTGSCVLEFHQKYTVQASEAGSAVLGAVAATDAAPEEDRVTVFAPTNEAFEAAAAAFGGELPAEVIPDVRHPHSCAPRRCIHHALLCTLRCHRLCCHLGNILCNVLDCMSVSEARNLAVTCME